MAVVRGFDRHRADCTGGGRLQSRAMPLQKKVVKSGVPETGGPFNLGVSYGPLVFISGLPPFDAAYSREMREARARGEKPPAYVPAPFDVARDAADPHADAGRTHADGLRARGGGDRLNPRAELERAGARGEEASETAG